MPIAWRRIYALATYLYLRGGELAVLEWADIDLEHGIVHSHRALARDQRTTKDTKTGVKRRYAIEPTLLPLVHTMKAESDGEGRLVHMGDRKHWAKNLREHLRVAGVERADLYANDETRKHITFHDLKATAGTWMAIRGDNPMVIMQRLAHRDMTTTMLYVRAAEMVGASVGAPFPDVPAGNVDGHEMDEGPAKRSVNRSAGPRSLNVCGAAGNRTLLAALIARSQRRSAQVNRRRPVGVTARLQVM